MRSFSFVLALAAAAASAGEATVHDEFVIAAPFAAVTKWIDNNGDAIRSACNVELLEADGGTLTLRRANNRGRWVWRQTETVAREAGRWVYETRLVESIEGGIERLDGAVTLQPGDGGHTRIVARTSAVIDGLPDRDVSYDLKTRARRIKKLLKEALE